jgi:iron complex outermembrane receptor protein
MPTAKPYIGPYADNRYVSYTLTDQMSMLDDKLQVILGVRYQDISTESLVPYSRSTYNSDKVSPSLGIVLKPFGEDLSLYASYVEGLSEGKTVDSTLNDVNKGKTFAPYQTKQYEVGTKYQTGSWLNTLALYQIEKPDTMVTVFAQADVNGNTQITTDDAKTRSRGIELSTAGQLTEDLSLMANLAYIDAEYVKSGPPLKLVIL